uniref:Uncharacterized protein n=1 Tax=Nothobranchius furzeri TaxID=105023 RepID=A0A8C6NNN4_NOTFU
VVEGRRSVLHGSDSPGEEEERENSCREMKSIFIDLNTPNDVPHEEEERVSSRSAETFPIDGDLVPVQELDAFLQTPEAALQTGTSVMCSSDGWIFHHGGCNDPDDLNQRQDQRAKGQGAGVVPKPNKSYGSPERGEDGVRWDVIWLLKGPVIRCKCPRQGHLTQGRHKVCTPEEQEDVVELKQDEVFVVDGLTTVKSKQTLSVERLRRNQEEAD